MLTADLLSCIQSETASRLKGLLSVTIYKFHVSH